MGHRTHMRPTLEHKRIVLAVTGSIAAVETIKLAHELRRRGASVTGILSPAACGIIHPDALTYACAEPALTKITGMVEHVLYCGEGGKADLLLIAPATANTIGKIACGIDDTIVTTFATTAIGRGMPVVIVPAMHESMYRHPAVIRNLETLREMNITVVPPRMEEEKAKIAGIEEICLYAERALAAGPLTGRRVLITSGSCREDLDDVRILTTRSSGTSSGLAQKITPWGLPSRTGITRYRSPRASASTGGATSAGPMSTATCSTAPRRTWSSSPRGPASVSMVRQVFRVSPFS